jgi:hypothetical protein
MTRASSCVASAEAAPCTERCSSVLRCVDARHSRGEALRAVVYGGLWCAIALYQSPNRREPPWICQLTLSILSMHTRVGRAV